MSSLLKIPSAIMDTLNSMFIKNQLNTTTWLVLGGLFFQLLTLILTQRLALLLLFAALFARLVPTILVSTNNIPNPELATIAKGKTTALFPNPDGSQGSPAGRGLALLIIGVKISHPLGLLAPGAKQTGDYFLDMVKSLNKDRARLGYLGGQFISGDNGHSSLIAYFDSMEKLHAFAHAEQHREAWNWWNKNVKNMPHIGVYHEAYDVPKNHWEAVYLQTPKMGLGSVKTTLSDGTVRDVLTDARKGPWKSSGGRMGRDESFVPASDPYRNE